MDSYFLLVRLIIFSLCSAFLPTLIKWVVETRQRKSEVERQLLTELKSMKIELMGISIVDEFARHAKLQRKITKMQDDLKSAANSRMLNATKNKALYTQLVNAALGLYLIYLVWNYRYEPVLRLSEGWLYPIDGLLSWPTGEKGAISVAAWLTLSRTSIRVFSGLKA
ncbi:Hypothetical predicted protein [Cloeon dipterum]|uniref:Guided entry of tail-anchored proteins factor 1 n=1 Tax=Cloeon dipterum TaxID=197152 RepID=A0A8S1CVL5_9INSE|nr:Hypothetical predicted protein [Cloeon dipterum]